MSLRLFKSYLNLMRHKFRKTHFKFSPFASTDLNSTFGHYVSLAKVDIRNSVIGDFTYVANGTNINRCCIGKFCSVGPRSLIGGLGKHPLDFISTHPMFYSNTHDLKIKLVTDTLFSEFENTIIGNDVWIGANVTILDGVTIGDGAIIAAGAVVVKNVGQYEVVGGVPAKTLKHRFGPSEITCLIELKWWDWDLEKINSNKDFLGGRFRKSDFS